MNTDEVKIMNMFIDTLDSIMDSHLLEGCSGRCDHNEEIALATIITIFKLMED